MPDKVQNIVEFFACNKEKIAVFTNATFINEKGEEYCQETVFDWIGFTGENKKWFDNGHAFEVFLRSNRATGATMAFRREAIQITVSEDYLPHDYLIALKAIYCNALGYIDTPCICYRQHGNNVTNMKGNGSSELYSSIIIADPVNTLPQYAIYLPKEWQESCRFLEWRYNARNLRIGVCGMLLHWRRYKRVYHDSVFAKACLRADLQSAVKVIKGYLKQLFPS